MAKPVAQALFHVFPFLALIAAAPASAQVQPWTYDSSGNLVWERHQFHEDTASSVHSLAWDFVTVAGQPTPLPDVLLLNGPHFDPPEGIASPLNRRKLLRQSIEGKALQLLVNYSEVPVGTNPTPKYFSPTFFLSLDPSNTQTNPPVLDVGLSSVFITPTRAALGNVGGGLQQTGPLPFGIPLYTGPINALYVTAGIGVALSEFDPASQAELASATQDRLFVRQADQTWLDRSSLLPGTARDGNSSGVCFADFNGDGYADLFVGKPGDNFAGAQSRLLIYRPPSVGVSEAFLDETGARMPIYQDAATVDVAAADLDLDGDADIVVANRARRGAAIGTESLDYAFVNDGVGFFTRLDLSPVFSDSRSVAVGDIDHVAGPEIVLGNAGADGFGNTLLVPASDDHPLQIFRDTAAGSTLAYQDVLSEFISGNESEISRPFTWQVMIVDLFGAGANDFMPDGKADLLLVNHRDILKDWAPGPIGMRRASNLRILVNPATSSTRTLTPMPRVDLAWATTVAVADFTHNTGALGDTSPGSLDLFVGTGNGFSGCDSFYLENRGALAASWPPWNESDALQFHLSYDAMPGNERGYGFDFADFNANGKLDALQAARGYDFLVTDLLAHTGHQDNNTHWNLTRDASAVDFSNVRGQLFPIGCEDGVFADFDLDGHLDVLLASQTKGSPSHPAPAPETSETVLLRGPSVATTGFVHDTATVQAFDVPSGDDPDFLRDLYVDIKQRNAFHRPKTADRAHAVDFDNDGEDDALVHLFPILNPSGSGPDVPQLGTYGLTSPIARYSAGWRLLRNITNGVGGAPPPWLEDLADARLHDGSATGPFSSEWNRELGVDVLADFDNNGACDFFTAVGGKQVVDVDVSTVHQGHDLLFMNGVLGAALGHFVERSAALLVPQRELPLDPLLPKTSTAGCSGLAQGDVDNDGDADLFVSCGARDFYSELLINRLNTGNGFTDELNLMPTPRVPTAVGAVSTSIHSLPFVSDASRIHDDAGAPILADLDADGDLDLVYAVADNVPRFYRNKGQDSNQDGFITSADTPAPGFYEDWTSSWVQRMRPIVDSVDAQAVDIDRDGDLDLAFDCFDDEVVLWRNDAAQNAARPTLTQAWPRVGATRGRKVVLEGVHLTGARAIELKARASGQTVTISSASITSESNGRISFFMPANAPLGLVQVRVRRSSPPTPADEWSRQYFGYFVLGP